MKEFSDRYDNYLKTTDQFEVEDTYIDAVF